MSKKEQEIEENVIEEGAIQGSEEVATEDYKEKWQRALADLENSRRRFEQEKANLIRYGTEGLLEDLLPVIDNFYRATEHVPEEQKNSPWVTGIQYIQKNLIDVLEGRGVKEIPAKKGDQFDASIHEAIAAEEHAELPDNSILEVKNRGYRLHEKVLRPVQVVVTTQSNN